MKMFIVRFKSLKQLIEYLSLYHFMLKIKSLVLRSSLFIIDYFKSLVTYVYNEVLYKQVVKYKCKCQIVKS